MQCEISATAMNALRRGRFTSVRQNERAIKAQSPRLKSPSSPQKGSFAGRSRFVQSRSHAVTSAAGPRVKSYKPLTETAMFLRRPALRARGWHPKAVPSARRKRVLTE